MLNHHAQYVALMKVSDSRYSYANTGTHTGQKPYQGEGIPHFLSEIHFPIHTHTGNNPYQCTICNTKAWIY